MADTGENKGLLVDLVDDARADLLDGGSWKNDPKKTDVEHAIALFTRHGASREDKRSAVVALAGVLESHRESLKGLLCPKDEGALFNIANSFDLRHRDKSQKADYRAEFLDWIFWWYLATVELSNRVSGKPSQITKGID